MEKQLHTIILASTSPRRKELLSSIGVSFSVVPSEYEEDMTLPLPPGKLTLHLAIHKALAVAKLHPDAIIIAADTIISTETRVLGKAHTNEEAEQMILSLSGKTHNVLTGLAVVIPPRLTQTKSQTVKTHVSRNKVTFKKLDKEEIAAYVSTGEPLGKAGAYAIQGKGAFFVEKIEGSYSGIVGLPIEALYMILRSYRIDVL
jgi:septum formation protein